MSMTEDQLTVGTVLNVPRTGGHVTCGKIIAISGDAVVVEFYLNGTYRGEVTQNNCLATKKVTKQKLLEWN